jgi:hypothetical protein
LALVQFDMGLFVEPMYRLYPKASLFWLHLVPAAVAGALLLPLILYDMVRFTHRCVGPIVRVQRALNDLAWDRHVEPIRLRNGDFWQELVREFNLMLEQTQYPRELDDETPDHDETLQRDAQASRHDLEMRTLNELIDEIESLRNELKNVRSIATQPSVTNLATAVEAFV